MSTDHPAASNRLTAEHLSLAGLVVVLLLTNVWFLSQMLTYVF